MLGAHRQTAKPERRKLLTDRSLMHDHAKAVFDLALEVAAAPADHPVDRRVRPITDNLRQFRLLLGLSNGVGPAECRFDSPSIPSAL